MSSRRYAEAALTGEGARLFGGRWNSVGTPAVYASTSLALAVLEVFVHMRGPAQPDDYVYVAIDLGVDQAEVERVDPGSLPRNWMQVDNSALQGIGDDWARSRRSLALLVPSVIVEGEWNVVINPLHPKAAHMVVQPPRVFAFDARMFKEKS